MPKSFTLPEAANFARCSIVTMRRYVKAGALPASFIAGKYVIAEADLVKLMHRGKRPTPKPAVTPTTPASV